MKKIIFFYLLIHTSLSYAQTSKDYSILLSATVQKTPPKITLNWNYHIGTTGYSVYRKSKEATNWGTAIANLPGTDTTYIDNSVLNSTTYEYRIEKSHSSLTGVFNTAFQGSGKTNNFIYSGIEIAENPNKGKVILLIDSTIYDSLIQHINQWIIDAESEGWATAKIIVSRSRSTEFIKTLINNEYQKLPSMTKALFIVGHVPVPYSGGFKAASGYTYPPDAHTDHVAAWPADVYYGDMDGSWSDNTVDDSTGGSKRNWNLIGDGKWDVTSIGTDNYPELQVGRVDFFNLPAFSSTERQLLVNYFVKCHSYKIGQNKPIRRGLIDDNFGGFSGESFASTAWNNMSSLLGKDKITLCDTVNKYDFINTMDTASYLWSYGCGAGSYNSCSGIGTTNNLATKNIKTTFTMMFGSYFGDWDSPNNILRGTLASGNTLSCVWSGRPRWYFHHMGLGETLGYATTLTQINSGAYPSFSSGGLIHIALLGDPTLKMHYVKPASNLIVTNDGSYNLKLSWTASTDNILGYNIYRKTSTTDYIKINKSTITNTQYIDSCLNFADTFFYSVKGIVLEQSASGSYFNESIGILGSGKVSADKKITAGFSFSNVGVLYNFTNTSLNATSYRWQFGVNGSAINTNPSPSYTYISNGLFTVKMTAYNLCDSATISKSITVNSINSSISSYKNEKEIKIYPNPSTDYINIESEDNGILKLIDMTGKAILIAPIKLYKSYISLITIPRGNYILEFTNQNNQKIQFKFVKE